MNRPSDMSRSDSLKYALLFAFAWAATIGLRLELIANKASISHDEAITYLSATCHQAEYSEYVFDGRPTPASTWKEMLQLEERFCFRQISADLGRYDIHPPLYFWLLHIWSIAVGVAVWSGPALNTVIAAFTTILLYRFARSVLKRQSEAILVTFSYALNVSVTSVSGLARQYDLLILITLLLVWTTVRYAASATDRWLYILPLSILSGLGGLTHYHFILAVTACVVFLFVRLRSTRMRRLVQALVALIFGYLFSFIIHPHFAASVATELSFFGALHFSVDSLMLRLLRLANSIGTYYYLVILVMPLLIWYLYQRKMKPAAAREYLRQTEMSGMSVIFFAVWIGGGIIFLYLTSITPLHQMSPKYFAMAWPFLSFVPVFILRFVRQRPTIAFYLYLFPLALSLLLPLQKYAYGRDRPDADTVLGDAEVVLVDNVARGIFPRIVWQAGDDSTFIALSQDALLDNPGQWMADLGDELVYVSEISYGGTRDGQLKMIGLLEGSGFEVTAVDGNIADAGTVFRVRQSKLAQ